MDTLSVVNLPLYARKSQPPQFFAQCANGLLSCTTATPYGGRCRRQTTEGLSLVEAGIAATAKSPESSAVSVNTAPDYLSVADDVNFDEDCGEGVELDVVDDEKMDDSALIDFHRDWTELNLASCGSKIEFDRSKTDEAIEEDFEKMCGSSRKSMTCSTINEFDSSSLLTRSKRDWSLFYEKIDNRNRLGISPEKFLFRPTCLLIRPAESILIGEQYVEISKFQNLLDKSFVFLTGAKTFDGLPILTFPDHKVQLQYADYRFSVLYHLQILPYEDYCNGFVVIIDRRTDKWTSVKTILSYLSGYFPAVLRAVYLVKPKSIIQRTLEIGYKSFLESLNFPLILCNLVEELHCYINPSLLTIDLGGFSTFDYADWANNTMDVERVKFRARSTAECLREFGQYLKESDVANDVETTQILIENQQTGRSSIKDELKVTSKQGFMLLKQIRQLDAHPNSNLLSPTRLRNVTTVERLLVQLEDTERSFDKFWAMHENRLQHKLQLRRFEEDFRKSQSNFAYHMIFLEENRGIGNNVDLINCLISKHRTYMEEMENFLKSATELQEKGQNLIETEEIKEMSGGSLRPKCEELERMNSVLKAASQRRLEILRKSKFLHEQISAANAWCNKGVEILITLSPFSTDKNRPQIRNSMNNEGQDDGNCGKCEDTPSSPVTSFLSTANSKLSHVSLSDLAKRLDDFLAVGDSLKLDSLREWHLGPETQPTAEENFYRCSHKSLSRNENFGIGENSKKFRITTDTSVLLGQVSARVSDIKRMCENRKSYLCKNHKISSTDLSDPEDPIKIISDSCSEKECCSNSIVQPNNFQSASIGSKIQSSRCDFVVQELLSTENMYVKELQELIDFYARPFQIRKNGGNNSFGDIFQNLQELFDFHSTIFLPGIKEASCRNLGQLACCFMDYNENMDALYRKYCQNKSIIDKNQDGTHSLFFQECQHKAGHRLPLGAYLLKPVQRITKYQLLLKELAKTCQDAKFEHEVNKALECMLNLLQQLNSSFVQSRIVGYPGNFAELGATLMHGSFVIWRTKKNLDKTARLRRTGKAQRRHFFLFPKSLLFCKVRRPSSNSTLDEYYEFKMELPVSKLHVFEDIQQTYNNNCPKFELTYDSMPDLIFLCQAADANQRLEWIKKIHKVISVNLHDRCESGLKRPLSWTSPARAKEIPIEVSLTMSFSGDTNNNPVEKDENKK